jgi:hypothetical protein
MSKVLTVCLLLYGIVASSLCAQQTKQASEKPARIRWILLGEDTRRLSGIPVSIGTDTVHLVLKGATDTIAIPRASIRRLEQRSGRRSNLGRGAAIGAVTGGVLGGAAMAIWSMIPEEGYGGHLELLATGLSVAGGAAIGALLGGAAGLMSSHERWAVIPAVSPGRGPVAIHLGFTLRVNF